MKRLKVKPTEKVVKCFERLIERIDKTGVIKYHPKNKHRVEDYQCVIKLTVGSYSIALMLTTSKAVPCVLMADEYCEIIL